MMIQSSTVAMRSKRMTEHTKLRTSVSSWGNIYAATLPLAKESDTIKQKTFEETDISTQYFQNYTSSGRLQHDEMQNEMNEDDVNQQIQISGSRYEAGYISETSVVVSKTEQAVMQRTLGGTKMKKMSLHEWFALLIERRKDFLRKMLNFDFSSLKVSQSGTYLQIQRQEYVEKESQAMQFSSVGNVMTADGREIQFNIDVKMQSSLTKHLTMEKQEQLASVLTDPLVINLDCDAVQLENSTFSFDINADGKNDNIAILSQMCGYLALDRNEDGIINDGSELFGAKTGDGFAELAVYDLDHNGWIDENDEIFDKLQIWRKTAQGKDELVGLGVAGVGAIYLGKAAADFEIKSASGQTQAMVRSSGVYLRENGTVGTIQQVDMAG